MSTLSAQDLLAIWERGYGQRPMEKGLTMLRCLHPEEAEDRLAGLTIGEKERLLIILRERIFGSRLHGFAVCPQCREKLEFEMDTADLLKGCSRGDGATPGLKELSVGEFRLVFRVLNSSDLAAALKARTPDEAKAVLLERCIEAATHNGASVEISALPEDVIAELEARLAEADAGGEILISLECPSCRHSWRMDFDIASFFYAEISAWARRLLEDVHALAAAYGWSEREILAMSAVRRQFYLEKAG